MREGWSESEGGENDRERDEWDRDSCSKASGE